MKCFDAYIEKMGKAQNNLLEFLGDEKNSEENFQNLINFLIGFKVQKNQRDLKEFLHLLYNILDNHQRSPNFFPKIDRILQYIKEDIKKYFDNSEIFNIFKNNKRILLFLYEEKIIEFDEYVIKKFMLNDKYEKCEYISYFLPEIKEYLAKEETKINKKMIKIIQDKTQSAKNPKDFNEKRKVGENGYKICRIIQKDDINEFIEFIQQQKISFNKTINYSVFEANSFLNDHFKMQMTNRYYDKISLIEYAAFYGSIQIFTYLQNNGVKLTPSLWIFAIHGNNVELINILENNDIKPKDSFIDVFKEAIRCHHNSIANYLEKKYLINSTEKSVVIQSLKYHNYAFIKENCIDQSFLVYLCKYDYPIFVEMTLETLKAKEVKENIIYIYYQF